MLLQHKKVRSDPKNESKRTFLAFILFFQKTPTPEIAVYSPSVAFYSSDGLMLHNRREMRLE